ncbi:MAG: phytanoyl-CoA dioxygenase family protein, partial [Pricia sp.]|nr:phytanoyl-CoA dioxygenase family protein [Pricia sp.]
MAQITDFANEHRMVSDLFDWPKSEGEWEQYRLTDEQVAHFHDQGYVSGIKLLNDRQIEV